MAEQETEWQAFKKHLEEKGVLAKPLYAVLTTPAEGRGYEDLAEHLPAHLAYQVELEQKGIMFAAGPLASDDETKPSGEGLVIIRAASVEEAHKIAAADPMHKSGARTYRIRPWLINEGSLTVKVTYSDGGREII